MVELTPQLRFEPPRHDKRTTSPSPRRKGRWYSSEHHSAELIPTLILRAFTEGSDPDPSHEISKHLTFTRTSSPAEQALGIRAAKAAIGARQWTAEIAQWNWPGSFEGGGGDTAPQVTPRESDHRRGSPLSPAQVSSIERRVGEIKRELEELDLEDLKGCVQDMHGMSRSRMLSTLKGRSKELHLMDDFSLVITQMVVQILPFLIELTQGLELWSARISVLRTAPMFLRDLDFANANLKTAQKFLVQSSNGDISRSTFQTVKVEVERISGKLSKDIASLGQRLDAMLDTLEGRSDSLPDAWIDDFENLEATYSRWVIESQRLLLELEVCQLREAKGSFTSQGTVNVTENTQDRQSNILGGGKAEILVKKIPTNLNGAANEEYFPVSAHRHTISGATVTPETWSKPEAAYKADDSSKLSSKDSRGSSRSSLLQEAGKHCFSRDESEDSNQISPNRRTPSADFAPDSSDTDEDVTTYPAVTPVVLKRASLTSVESFSRGQVKAINVRRTSSISSASSIHSYKFPNKEYEVRSRTAPPMSPSGTTFSEGPDGQQGRGSLQLASPLSPLEVTAEEPGVTSQFLKHVDGQPRTPTRSKSVGADTPPSGYRSSPSSPLSEFDGSPSVRYSIMPPLNSLAVRKRSKNTSMAAPEMIPSNNPSPASGPDASPETPEKKTLNDLEKQISEILTTVPAPIRLATASEANPPKSKSRKSTMTRALQSLRPSRSSKAPAEMTLSPVKDEPGSRKISTASPATSVDPDIRLYHLTQPGRDQPIKLFIRRVGENGERVMVRVGGGWADLGEYLRQYAEHHGRRTVSDGRFEILSNNVAPVPVPSALGGATSANVTPTRLGAGAPPHVGNAATITPVSGARSALAPDSAGGSAGSHRSWTGDEVGLAGPMTKKLDLSGEKRDWIEGMMNQARSVSSSGAGFGDLGKVGGTKRVFHKHGAVPE